MESRIAARREAARRRGSPDDGHGRDAPASGLTAPEEPPPDVSPTVADARGGGALSNLPIAGLTRRRLAWVLAVLAAGWIIVVFARQVAEASSASALEADVRAGNEVLARDVAGLENELALIAKQEYILQQARGQGLGGRRERAFSLDADAPPLTDRAPGSAATALGARETRRTPLETWLALLFGPGD